MRRPRPNLLAIAAAAGAAAAACGAGGAPGPDAAPIALVLGSSPTAFEPLTTDGPLPLLMGPQGGFHVYLTLRAAGIDPGDPGETPRACADSGRFANPCIDFDIIDLDTQRALDAFVALRLPLTSVEPGSYDLLPPRVVPLAVHGFDEVDGHRLQVRASLDDAGGRHAATELTVICMPAR